MEDATTRVVASHSKVVSRPGVRNETAKVIFVSKRRDRTTTFARSLVEIPTKEKTRVIGSNIDGDSRRGGGKGSVMAIFNSVKNNKKFLVGGRRSIEDVDEEYYDEYRRANNISPDHSVKNPILNGGGGGSPAWEILRRIRTN